MFKQDAPLDDPDLLKDEKKKPLIENFMPYALINIIKSKEDESDFKIEEQAERKSCEFDTSQENWCVKIIINGATAGQAMDVAKKMAQHKAALNMFHNIFPKGTTWMEAREHIAKKQKPLGEL